MRIFRFTSFGFVFLIFFWLFSPTVLAATEIEGEPGVNTTQVGRYQKFEITFQISRKFPGIPNSCDPSYNPNDPVGQEALLPYYYYDSDDTPAKDPGRNSPYGVDGITIDAHFRAPSGRELAVPAFYYQAYTRSGDSVNPASPASYSWRIRFAPAEIGSYTYYLTINDKNGFSRYPSSGNLSFSSVASDSKGFIGVSPRDPRFFEFDNGESFVPISSARQWVDNRTSNYDDVFDDFGAHGINFVRIWDQNCGYNLTVEGHFDFYDYRKDCRPTDSNCEANLESITLGTQMNQRGNFEEDLIIEAAEQNKIKIQLCAHGEPYWIWDASVYGPPDDPWNQNRVNFMNQYHLNYVKRNYRYRVARWGYSTSILAWEYWNEQDRDSTPSSDLYQFYQTISNYVREIDPYKHLITTSNGSQNWRLNLWSSGAFDYANYHDYLRSGQYPSYYNDEVKWVYVFAQCLRANSSSSSGCGLGMNTEGASWQGNKPIIWGECDLNGNQWEENPDPTFDHNVLWAGLFSPIGMTPIDWYFGMKSSWIQDKFDWGKIAADFFKNIDYAGEKFSYLSTSDVRITSESLSADNSQMRVLAMRSSDKSKAYAWVQHKGYTWGKGNQSSISGKITLPGMAAGNYTIEYWNTHNGQKTSGGTVTASSGNVQVNVTGLTNDLAIKVISTSLPPTTPTPTPTPPSACAGLGDVDCDGDVDKDDALKVLQNWLFSSPNPFRADANGDGKVNGVDFGLVVKDWSL